jgi:CRP-like cAMP-binding protein
VLLRQLAIIHGQVDADVAVVDLDLTQGTLAQMLGASREAVNKQLRALAKEGRLEMDGPRIKLFRSSRK